ncbi:MAG: hypothetical protein AB7O98_04620 [Hyphomonadaceae bacterium]
MRTLLRTAIFGSALALGALGLLACQRQADTQAESAQAPTDAEREAEIAAEQLAALGGPASAEQRAAYEGEFQASGGIDALASPEGGGGGEGAWELRLLEDYAQFSRPGLGEDGGIPGERDYRERGMRVVAGAVTVTIMQQPCTASGLELPYVAHVLYEGVAYQGCARRGIDEGERPTWASVLPELIPSIDACLAQATSQPVRITFASALGDGEYTVRLREGNGARRECITTAGQVSVFETLGDLDRRGGEGDPEFQRGSAQPRVANCRVVEPAIARSGEQLGWLIRSTC